MNAEDLIVRAAAHGIDLRHVAGSSTDTKGLARARRPTADEGRQGGVRETVSGRETRTYRKPAWTHSELGQALAGVPRMPELAAYYSLCGYLPAFGELHRGMQVLLLRRSLREEQDIGATWPMTITYRDGPGIPYDYIPKLSLLVLVYEANRQAFISAPGLPAALLNVNEPVWRRQLEPRYQWLENEYQRWMAIALSIIGQWIRGPSERAEAATA